MLMPLIAFTLFIFKKSKNYAHKILIIWILVDFLGSLLEILESVEIYPFHSFLMGMSQTFFMANAFFFHAYLHAYIQKEYQLKSSLPMFIPLLVWLMLVLFPSYAQGMEAHIATFEMVRSGQVPILHNLLNVFLVFSIVWTGFKAYFHLKEKKKLVPLQVKNLLFFIQLIVAMFCTSLLIDYVSPPKQNYLSEDWIFMGIALGAMLAVYALLFFNVWRQQPIYAQEAEQKTISDKIVLCFNKIQTLMKKEKPYKDPEFSVAKLASLVEESTNTVAEALKENLNTNFFTYINQYRVEEVKSMLLNPDYNHYAIISIGLEAGFNSKATFHRVFKQETGLTPTAYKEQIQKF
jgi:AraC-like DNA-binding protein